MKDIVFIVGAAALGSASIVGFRDAPAACAFACAILLAVLLARYHERRDLIGLAIGATIGNAIELACDAAGVWQHADRTVLSLAPVYILFCYPILGIATPRLVDAVRGGPRSPVEHRASTIPVATLLLIAFVGLALRFGQDAGAQWIVTLFLLAATLWRFHSRHDLVTALAGASVAMVWELPATASGAWRFPAPDVLGLIPSWLPAAYAVFFVAMGRLIDALHAEAGDAIAAWRQAPWTRQRRIDLAFVSSLIGGAVAGVCLFFSQPLVCAAISAAVLIAGLWRWHTRTDITIALCGAVFGPVLEYYATGAGLWTYPFTTIGTMPAWVFTLWPAFPLCLVRLTHTIWPAQTRELGATSIALIGIAILAVEIPLLTTYGNSRPVFTAGVTTMMLVASAAVMRSPQAAVMLTLSGVFGMLCEMLPIALGAWIYPPGSPLPFPVWLPTGYALFGFGIVQTATGLAAMRSTSAAANSIPLGTPTPASSSPASQTLPRPCIDSSVS